MKKKLIVLMSLVLSLSLALPAFAAPVLTDVPATHWAAEAVNMLVEVGVLTGYEDSTFRGQQNITRYEVAVSLQRLINYLRGIISEEIAYLGTGAVDGVSQGAIDQLRKEMNALHDNCASINDMLTLSGRLAYLESRYAANPQNTSDSGEIAALKAQVDALGKEVAAATSKLLAMANDITVLSGRIANAERNIEALKDRDVVFAKDIDTINKEIDDLKAYLASLTVGSSGNIEMDPRIYNDLLTLSGRLSYLEARYAALTGTDAALLDEINAIKAQIGGLGSQTSPNYSELINFTNDITVLSGRISNYERELENLKANNALLANDIAAIKKDIDSINAYMASMVVGTDGNVAVDPTLYNGLLTLSGRISFLETRYAATADADAAILAELEALKNKVNSMGSGSTINIVDMPALTNDITVLAGRMGVAEREIESLKAKNTVFANDIAAIKKDIDSINAYMASMVVGTDGSVTVDPTMYNGLLTLSGRIAFLETRYAATADADAAILAELEALKSKVNSMGSSSTINVVDMPTLTNDITVLAGRMGVAEREIENLKASNSTLVNDMAAVKKDIDSINAYMASLVVGTDGNVTVDPTIYNNLLTLSGRIAFLETRYAATADADAAILAELEALRNKVNSIGSGSTVKAGDMIALTNDITVLAGRLAVAERSIESINWQLEALQAKVNEIDAAILDTTGLTNDVTEINNQIGDIKFYLSSLVVDSSGEVKVDPTYYNSLLTLSGRISYLETKYAATAEMDAKVLSDIEALKNSVNALATSAANSTEIVKLTSEVNTLNEKLTVLETTVKSGGNVAPKGNLDNYLGIVLGYERVSGEESQGGPKTATSLMRITISGKYSFTDRLKVVGDVTLRLASSNHMTIPATSKYGLVPEFDIYGRIKFTPRAFDFGLQFGFTSVHSFDYDLTANPVKNSVFLGIGLYMDTYIVPGFNVYMDVKFPFARIIYNTSNEALDIASIPAFGMEVKLGFKFDICERTSIGIEAEISNMPKAFGTEQGAAFNVGVALGFVF